MDTAVDIVAAAVRALTFIALLQSAGLAMFVLIFEPRLERTAEALKRSGVTCAFVALLLVVVQHVLEAGRMAGEFGGIFDIALQQLAFISHSGVADICRINGVVLIATGLRPVKTSRAIAGIGVLMVVASFLLIGHTSIGAQRGLLASLLAIHLLVVAFWFGALLPLLTITRQESPLLAAKIVAAFTKLATWLVPLIAIAGLVLAYSLLPNVQAMMQPYGWLLLGKIVGFVVLMGLGAMNKWRLGPALANGGSASSTFQRSLLLEFAVACVVLSMTAVMTGFFSPHTE